MKDQQFDDFVKSKLGQYDSGISMQVWERIREKEKDDKKGFFFFRRNLLTGIALVALTGIGFLTWNSNSKNAEQKTATLSQINTNNNNKENTTSTAVTKNLAQTQRKNESTTESKPVVENAEIKIDNNNAVADNVKTGNKDNTSFTTDRTIKPNTSVVSNSENRKTNAEINKKESVITVNEKLIANTASGNEQQTDISIQATESKEYALNFTDLAVYRFSLQKFKIGNVPQQNNRPGCPTINGPRRNDLYIEVYGSPDYTMRSFSNPANLNGYIAQRRTSEDNRNGFSAGVRIAKNIGEKTLIKAGVNYSQINERLRIINANEKQITRIITIRTVIRAPGDTLFIRDTTYFEQNGTRYRTTYNRYRFIDLPIIFSYEFGNPEILAFAVNAGPVFNITSFYRGEVLDTTLAPVKISTAKGNGANNWRSNIGIGIFASFAVYKRINERLQIFGEPYFRYNFKPVTQNANIVNQRYSTSGMQLGIRYNLYSDRQRYR